MGRKREVGAFSVIFLYYRTPAKWTGAWLFQSGKERSFFNAFDLKQCPVTAILDFLHLLPGSDFSQ